MVHCQHPATAACVALFTIALGGATPSLAQDGLAELEAAAAAEGSLMIYTSNHDADMQAKVAAFEAKYPDIRVEFIRQPSSQVFTRFLSEREAGVTLADLLATGSSALYQTNPEFFQPLSPETLPVLGTQDMLIDPANDRYQIYVNDVQLVTYSTTAVSEEDLAAHLASWGDLSDPFWKDNIALVDPRNSNNQMSFLLYMQDLYGDEWFTGFMANNPELVGTASAASQQVAAGAFNLLVPTIPAQSAAIRAQEAPVGLYLPAGLNHVTASGAAVPVDAPHPNAGRLFLNWMLSPEAQILACAQGGLPNIEVDDPACPDRVPEDFSLARDVIPEAEAAKVLGLIGLQP